MAVIKHISIKNSNYDAAYDYLTTKHDEFTSKPILDENGKKIPRESFIIEGINCDPTSFGRECEDLNLRYGKNKKSSEIKAHHYIISFDPRDRDDNGLAAKQAQALGMKFAQKNFPGHQTLVCTHPDGHNSAGNIHVHIVINSVRAFDVTRQDFMERPGDSLAGHKHHVTKDFLEYLKSETMLMCQKEAFYQVDLLNPAKIRITDREYWAQRRGQAKLDAEAALSPTPDKPPKKYETEKGFLRRVITNTMLDSQSIDDFQKKLFEKFGIGVHESRGSISYLTPDRQKPIRGRSLGTDFEKDFIQRFIVSQQNSYRKPSGKRPDLTAPAQESIGRITDISTCEKAQQSPAYATVVNRSNLQKMAATSNFLLSNGISPDELEAIRAASKAHVKETHTALKETEAKLHKVDKMYKARLTLLKNKDVYKQFLDSPNRKKFREEHSAEILLYEAARRELQELTGQKKFPSLKDIKTERTALYQQRHAQYEAYSEARAHDKELANIETNMNVILDRDKPEITKDKSSL